MPRHKSPEPFIRWTVLIPAALAAEIEMLFFDPVHGKPHYGKRSELVTELLRAYLSQVKSGKSRLSFSLNPLETTHQ